MAGQQTDKKKIHFREKKILKKLELIHKLVFIYFFLLLKLHHVSFLLLSGTSGAKLNDDRKTHREFFFAVITS